MPFIPLLEVVGSVGAVLPEQIDGFVPKLNVGVIFGFTVTVNVAGLAHWPALGVKV